jgi:hypothetical protein
VIIQQCKVSLQHTRKYCARLRQQSSSSATSATDRGAATVPSSPSLSEHLVVDDGEEHGPRDGGLGQVARDRVHGAEPKHAGHGGGRHRRAAGQPGQQASPARAVAPGRACIPPSAHAIHAAAASTASAATDPARTAATVDDALAGAAAKKDSAVSAAERDAAAASERRPCFPRPAAAAVVVVFRLPPPAPAAGTRWVRPSCAVVVVAMAAPSCAVSIGPIGFRSCSPA